MVNTMYDVDGNRNLRDILHLTRIIKPRHFRKRILSGGYPALEIRCDSAALARETLG